MIGSAARRSVWEALLGALRRPFGAYLARKRAEREAEDAADLAVVEARRGEPTVSLEQVKRELGL
jgi:hypothetical protein